jgi:hypothetical protein
MSEPKQKPQKAKPEVNSPEIMPGRKARWGNSKNFTFTPYNPDEATKTPNPEQ